jgi:thiosulfate/3-mercaptopyruvate sulfurtransferase
MAIDPVITPQALRDLEAPVVFDCRAGADARKAYAEGHLPGAFFVDLETDLADTSGAPAQGGRHPLIAPDVFARKLGAWGVTPERSVVVYDDQAGANAAARMWWMLRALGHERVQVLDGGLSAALAAGYALTTEVPRATAQPPYPSATYRLPIADLREVDAARNDPQRLVLDVRATFRFRGESEPIDPVAGHIPGAHNLPFADNLEDGRFKSAAALRAQYQALFGAREGEQIIVHCGSGVTACHTLLALERAGLPPAKLYVGSWGEWCRNPELPVARGA